MALTLHPNQSAVAALSQDSKAFLEGPAGAGKTTAAVQRLLQLIKEGIPGVSTPRWCRSARWRHPTALPCAERGARLPAACRRFSPPVAWRGVWSSSFWPLAAGLARVSPIPTVHPSS